MKYSSRMFSYNRINNLNKKYLKICSNKGELSFREKIMREDLRDSIHLEENYEIFCYR